MKKGIIFLFILILLVGCTKEEVVQEEVVEDTPEEEVLDVYIDENPVTVGLYQNGKLVKDINASVKYEQDIASFDVYFTNEEDTGSSNTKLNFNKYYNNYENPSNYKIGFYISFNTGDKLMETTILDPSTMFTLNPYIFVYLYDDVHQADDAWYSHLEESDIKDDTVYSSIKLTAIHQVEEITSPITLKVFTYDSEDDFDSDGKYRGNSSYEIKINH